MYIVDFLNCCNVHVFFDVVLHSNMWFLAFEGCRWFSLWWGLLLFENTLCNQMKLTDFFYAQCRNPTLAKCGGEAQHLEKLEVGSLPGLPNVQSSTERGKTPRIGVFLVSLERSWNVDIENALALAIRTSAAQVMGKRRAGSQTGSLTPDH